MAEHVESYNPSDGQSYATAPTPKINNQIDTSKNNNEVATTEWVNAISDITREEILAAANKVISAFDNVPSDVTVSGILSAISRLDSNYENNVVKVSTPHVVETWLAEDKLSGYRKYSDGFIIQWYIYYKGSSVSGANTATFMVPFVDTNYVFFQYNLHGNNSGSGSFGGDYYPNRSVSSTVFNIPAGFYGYNWIVFGYC